MLEHALLHGEKPVVVETMNVFLVEGRPTLAPPVPLAVLYRAEATNNIPGRVCVRLSAFVILSYTAHGAWLNLGEGKKKFVNLRATRQWASADKPEALYHLICRRRRQVEILAGQLTGAREILRALA